MLTRPMQGVNLYVTNQDFGRLAALAALAVHGSAGDCARTLQTAVRDAAVVAADDVPPNVVTMRSVVRIRENGDGKEMTCTLVYPGEADYREGRISVLSPLGSRLLGRTVHERVSYEAPGGERTVEVLQVMYQPEANGDYES